MLREQLDQAHLANQQLTDDLRRTNAELQSVREDFTQKTRNWKEEERVSLKKKTSFFFYMIKFL
jgi:hypothetical protein